MSEQPLATTNGSGPPRFLFDDGAAYEEMMGRWSARVADPFLDWLALPPGLDWLDDGCGNGSFTEVLARRQQPASLVGVDPSPAQLAYARERPGLPGARWHAGDAQALPLPDASVDAAVMALVLFFLPDPALGLRELVRVVRPGGTIAAYHWDMAGGGFPLQAILDAVRADGHGLPPPPSNWVSSPEASQTLWREAGLVGVQTACFEVQRAFDSTDQVWRSAQGNPRLRALFASLAPEARERLQARVRDQLGAREGQPLVLRARATAVKGRRP